MAMRTRFRLISVVAWAVSLTVVAACDTATDPAAVAPPATGASGPATATVRGDSATWSLKPGQRLQESSTGFTALVTRLGCNGGITGEVLAPQIRFGEAEIVVTFAVAAKEPGAATCVGNNQVPYEVDLREPLRDRALVDGQCLPGAEATTTSYCTPDSTRFKP